MADYLVHAEKIAEPFSLRVETPIDLDAPGVGRGVGWG